MAGKTLLLLLASSFFTTVVSSPTDLDDVANEMVRRVEETKATKEEHNRNMQTWWEEYTTELKAYKDTFDQYACTDAVKLEADLTALEAKITKVRNGWSEKKAQLNAIRDILNDDRYKDVTGLHLVLNQYLEEQFRVVQEEDGKLTAEEAEVAAEKTKLSTHPCPCVWDEWADWQDCTVTCGGGTKNRTRAVLKEATNGGPACDGEAQEQEACNQDSCPIDCVLGDWTPWSDCDQVCGPGFKHRTRPVTTPAQFGGAECPDNANAGMAESIPCDLMAELKAKVATLETKNKALQRMATCDVSKCTAVVYKKCDGSPLCGTGQNGVTCAYLPDGIGQTGCGEEACAAVNGVFNKWSPVCDGGVAIDVTGGCFADLSMGGERYTSVLLPGFNALQGKFETIQGVEVDIGTKGIDEVKLFCMGH